MLIKYVHASEPETEKTYDTVKALKNNPFITLFQNEFDEMEMYRFEKDKKNGVITWFEIVKE